MKPNNKKTSTAAVTAQPQDTSIKWLATFLLIAYGYVTVITPNWMAFDSNATKFYTFAILNLVVVALVFFVKEFRERTQVLFGFFTNKIGIAYSLIMVMALLSFSKAINTEEAILHFFKIFTAFSAAWMVSALVIYYKEGIVVLALAMTILLCYDFLVAMDGIKGVIRGTATDLAIKGSYSNKNILASAIFIKIPFAVWLFYFRRENYLRLIGAVGLTLGTLAVFFMSTRTFYLATILTVVIFVIYGAIDFFILKRRETGVKVLIHVGLVVIAFGIFSFVQNYLYPQEVRQSTSFGARLAEVANQENASNKVRFLQYENSYSPHYIYMYKNHNDFLELTAEVGILGGLAFVAIFLLAAFYFFKGTYKNKNSEQEQWFFLPLFGLFAYSFDAFFNFPQDRPEIQALFGIYVGIAVGLAVLYFGKNSKERKLPTLAIGFIGAIAVVAMALGVIVERMYFDSSKIQRMVKEEQQGVRSPKSPADYLIRNYPRIPNLTAVAEPVDVEKARYLIDEQKFDEARKILSSIHYHPYDARPEYFMAVSYFMEPEKKLDSIYKYAHKARMIKPNFYGSLNLETFALNNLGKEQESIKLLKQYLSLEKDSVQKEEPKWRKRLKSIFHVDVDRDARLANRGEVQAWNSLAYLLEKNNQIAEARAVLDTAFVYLPTNQEIINNRNKIISRMQVEQFAPLYSEAMQLYLQQRYAEAIPVFTKFLEKVPAHIDGLKYRAISYYNTQQYQRAINDIAQMEQLGIPIDPVLNNYRASCYYMLGDRANAKAFFQKAAAEGNADAQKNLNTLTF